MTTPNQTFRGKVDQTTVGDAFNKSFVGVTTPGVLQTVINETVAAGKVVNLLQIFISCALEGKITILVDSTTIATGRTGPAESNFYFSWLPFEPVSAAGVIKVQYLGASYRPATDLEVFLQARET